MLHDNLHNKLRVRAG